MEEHAHSLTSYNYKHLFQANGSLSIKKDENTVLVYQKPGTAYIYYAHSKLTYGQPNEDYALRLLRKHFRLATIINPAQFQQTWALQGLTEAGIMRECFKLIEQADIVIFSSIIAGYSFCRNTAIRMISRRVYEEISYAESLGKPVYYVYKGQYLAYQIQKANTTSWKYYAFVIPQVLLEEHIKKKDIPINIAHLLQTYKTLQIQAVEYTQARDWSIQQLLSYSRRKQKQLLVFVGTNQDVIKYARLITESYQKNTCIEPAFVLTLFDKRILCIEEKTKNKVCTYCSGQQTVEVPLTTIQTLLQQLPITVGYKTTITWLKQRLRPLGCPYYILKQVVPYANILITTHKHLHTGNTRIALTNDILQNDFLNKVVLVDNIQTLSKKGIKEAEITKDVIEKIYAILPNIFIQKFLKIFDYEGQIEPIYGSTETLKDYYKKNKNTLTREQSNCFDTFRNFDTAVADVWISKENKICKYNRTCEKIFRYLRFFSCTVLLTHPSSSYVPKYIMENYKTVEV